MNVRRAMGALIGVFSGLVLAIVATGPWQILPDRTEPKLLYILAAVLVVFGGNRLPDLARSIWEAIYNNVHGDSGGFGPPGVPVESALCVPVPPKREAPDPPLPPL